MLASTIARNVYVGDGATSIYGWGPWLVNQASDLRVAVLSNAVPQVLTVLALGVDYSIQTPAVQIGNSNGGNIVLSASGFLAATGGDLPNGWSITIRRSVAFGQPGVLGNQEGSEASQIEDMIDYLAMQTLQLQDAMTRTIQTPIDDFAAPIQNLPVASLRANAVLGFDAQGDPMVTGGTIPPVGVTPFWVSILQLTTAALSRVGLGFAGPGGTVQTANIDPAGLGSAAYGAGSILTAAIGALQVTAANIANATITAAKIVAGTITTAEIAANTILAANMDPGVGLFETGDMVASARAAKTGWVICQGQSVLRAGIYAPLFAVIGTAFGSVDGTHFTLPDMRDHYPRGVTGVGPDIVGKITAAAGVAADANTASLSYNSASLSAGASNYVAGTVGGGAVGLSHTHTPSTQANVGLNWFIKI